MCDIYLGAYEGGKPDATFSFKDEDFVKVALGKMNPQMAFMRFILSSRKLPPFFVGFSSLFILFCFGVFTQRCNED